MKRTVSLLLATILLLCALPALADTAWTSPHQGATPEFIQGLDTQNPALGHTQTPGAWEYDHIQVGYTEVTREYAPSRHELAALYWAANAGLFDFAYNLNEMTEMTRVNFAANKGDHLHAFWAADRIFLLTITGPDTANPFESHDMIIYNGAADEVDSRLLLRRKGSVEEWLNGWAHFFIESNFDHKGIPITSPFAATIQQLF